MTKQETKYYCKHQLTGDDLLAFLRTSTPQLNVNKFFDTLEEAQQYCMMMELQGNKMKIEHTTIESVQNKSNKLKDMLSSKHIGDTNNG